MLCEFRGAPQTGYVPLFVPLRTFPHRWSEPFQVAFELQRGRPVVLVGDDIVPLEYARRPMPGPAHRDRLRHVGPDHVPDRRAAQIVKGELALAQALALLEGELALAILAGDAVAHPPDRLAGPVPCRPEIPDRAAAVVEHVLAAGGGLEPRGAQHRDELLVEMDRARPPRLRLSAAETDRALAEIDGGPLEPRELASPAAELVAEGHERAKVGRERRAEREKIRVLEKALAHVALGEHRHVGNPLDLRRRVLEREPEHPLERRELAVHRRVCRALVETLEGVAPDRVGVDLRRAMAPKSGPQVASDDALGLRVAAPLAELVILEIRRGELLEARPLILRRLPPERRLAVADAPDRLGNGLQRRARALPDPAAPKRVPDPPDRTAKIDVGHKNSIAHPAPGVKTDAQKENSICCIFVLTLIAPTTNLYYAYGMTARRSE